MAGSSGTQLCSEENEREENLSWQIMKMAFLLHKAHTYMNAKLVASLLLAPLLRGMSKAIMQRG